MKKGYVVLLLLAASASVDLFAYDVPNHFDMSRNAAAKSKLNDNGN